MAFNGTRETGTVLAVVIIFKKIENMKKKDRNNILLHVQKYVFIVAALITAICVNGATKCSQTQN